MATMQSPTHTQQSGVERERIAGRVLATWVGVVVSFIAASVVEGIVDHNLGNYAMPLFIGTTALAIWTQDRWAAWIIGALALLCIPLVLLIAMNDAHSNVGAAIMIYTLGLAVPGVLGSSLILDALRRVARKSHSTGSGPGPSVASSGS